MAGIGFRLQNLLAQGSYTGLAKAYVFSAIIATGPWMLSIIGLALLNLMASHFADNSTLASFSAVVIYTYAGTLIATGALQMGATRYIADRLYMGDVSALRPTYHFLAALVTILGGSIALGFWIGQGLTTPEILAATVLFQSVSLTWLGMIMLTAGRDYIAIVRAFAIGYGASVCGAVVGVMYQDLAGMLWGFAAGQLILVLLLGVRIWVEFPSKRRSDRRVIPHMLEHLDLAAVGLFFNIGIWADKIVMWCVPSATQAIGNLSLSPRYDACTFLAYISIVPAMAQFLIRVEVAFHREYSAYFAVITQGASMDRVMEAKMAMIRSLRLSAGRLLQSQGIVTLLCVAFAPQICHLLGLPPDHGPLLRVCLLAAFVQVMLQIALLIILYFDWRRSASLISILFASLNAGLTMVAVSMGERFYGTGYLAACAITLLVALIVIEVMIRDLEFITFSRQPMYP